MTNATAILKTLPLDVRLVRMEALVQASIVLNQAANLDDILLEILNLISSQLDCERATAFLKDERTGRLHARQMAGSEFIEIVLEQNRGIVGHTIATGESALVDDAHTDKRFDASIDRRTLYRTRTLLCVPLRTAEGKILGALQAINRRGGKLFSAEDLTYLEAFAVVAAIAVEREQLLHEVVRAHMLSTELQLAHNIQGRLLPTAGVMDLPAPFAAWGISQACYDVGGDMYDAVMLASGECAFWVADVSGKGIGAALLMTSLQTELRALVHTETDLTCLAAELNRRVQSLAPMGTYATLFIGRLSAHNGKLTYVNAGHQPPLWATQSNGACEDGRLQMGGFPIGLLPGASYEEGQVEFADGARLTVFSDGMTDAQNTAGRTFDEAGIAAGLCTISRANSNAPVEEIGTGLLADLNRFRIGAPPQDDTTLFVIGLDERRKHSRDV